MNLNSIIPWREVDRQIDRRREDGDPFAALQHRMNSLFDDFFGYSSSDSWESNGTFAPRLEVNETGREIRISAELPGLDGSDLEVTCSGNMLTIKGEKKEEKEEEKGNYWHSERSYGYFERSVQLPDGVDADKAKAKFKKGVLKVTLPKKPEAQSTSRRIELASN